MAATVHFALSAWTLHSKLLATVFTQQNTESLFRNHTESARYDEPKYNVSFGPASRTYPRDP
ncbi:hypothetical protein TUN199_08379 [Pyrenophora tritici-repentis]|nr:hypothetical protein TUN205_08406 [Pyrenophora tritici-repentis]KAI0619628.1 hypothetical protein TUN199_08379 [Pyrenophora tritici-repentis]